MKKAVFTDLDGTLLKGFITIDFVEYLHNKKLFNENAYLAQKKLMQRYVSGEIEFVPWLQEWANVWGNGICGLKKKVVLDESKIFFSKFKKNIYPSSIDLVEVFHKKGYLVVGVSVGVIETADLVKSFLGLDEVFASKVEVKKGVYGDKVITDFQTENGKENAIRSFCVLNNILLENCIGIGDNVHDKQIFDLMGKNIALNPSKDLLPIAEKKGYLIANHTNVLEKIKSLL